MAVMAELGDIGVADMLYLLAMRGQTGRLTVRANGDEVSFYLEHGRLVLVTSSSLSLRLGQILRRHGALTIQQLHQALREQEQAGSRMPLGSILLARGWVTEEALSRCVQEQAIIAVARVIAADHGTLVYTGGITAPRGIEIVPLRADHILLEAARRIDELSQLQAHLPAPHAPLMLAGRIEDVADGLTDAEVPVALALSDRVASVADLGKTVALEESELSRAILGLRERGLLEVGQAPRALASILPEPSAFVEAAGTAHEPGESSSAPPAEEPAVDGPAGEPTQAAAPAPVPGARAVLVLGSHNPSPLGGFPPHAVAPPLAGAA